MSAQKPLTSFFKPLQSGGVKRPFSELVTGTKQTEPKTPQKENSLEVNNCVKEGSHFHH